MMINRTMFIILCVMWMAGMMALVFVATGPAKGAEPPAWLVPTLVLPDGSHVTGADGWHPLPYSSMMACETQRALARFMTPPGCAQEVLWQCLPYNPIKGRGA